MLKRILGLDLGISSIGWALIDINDEEFINNESGEVFAKQGKIIDSGVRIFDPCENNKDKSPSAEPRRIARLNRRRLSRKSTRCKKIRELCERTFNIKLSDDIFKNSLKNENFKDVWILRKEALERKLSKIELSRVLCHIIKHRGWASRRKSEEVDEKSESGKMKKAIDELKNKLSDNETAGYYYGKNKAESLNFDNEKIINEYQNYDHCIGRKQNEDELKKIFEKQKNFGFEKLSQDFEVEVLKLLNFEKEMKSMKDMIGYCLFESGEYRAPKESYSAELFNVYSKINNLKVLDLSKEDYNDKFDKLINLFKNKKEVKYIDIKKELSLDDEYKFKGLDYSRRESIEQNAKKQTKEEIENKKEREFEDLKSKDLEKIEKYKEEGFEEEIIKINNKLIHYFKRVYNIKRNCVESQLNIEDGYKILEEKEKALLITDNNKIAWIKRKSLSDNGILKNSDKNKVKNSKYSLEKYLSGEITEYKTINPEESKLYSMTGYHKIKDVLTKKQFEIIENNPFLIDKIMEALAYEKNDARSKEYMLKNNVPEEIIENCLKISTKDFIHISCKAIKNLLPFLRQGLTYDKACKKCGYEFKDDAKENLSEFLPTIEKYTEENEIAKLTNPVVRRTISQTRKVINAIIRKYGSFDQINIEFTRDLGKSVDERIKIERGQKTFRDLKDEIRKEVSKELNIKPELVSDMQVLKYRLYKQQDGKSLYSLTPFRKLLTVEQILSDDKCCEIDHILPYSKSFDDSLNNKVLVLSKENQEKRNRIPYEYLKDSNWEEWKKIIWSIQSIPYRKKKNLTTEDYDFVSKWKARNLCDTSYVAKYLTKYLLKNLKFKENDKLKNKIQVRPGQLTSYLRHIWGLGEKNRNNDTHHMVDAIIIACATQSMCQLISTIHANERGESVKDQQREIFEKIKRLEEKGDSEEIKEQIKQLEEESKWYNLVDSKHMLEGHCKLNGIWEGFNKDVDDAVKKLTEVNIETGLPENHNIVSRMARRKVTGEAHKATVEGLNEQQNITTAKTRLNKLTLKNIENLQDKDGNSKNLYNILKQRLEEYKGDAEKAFKDPIYMSNKNGEFDKDKTPQIKTVKLVSAYNGGGVSVNNGIATNGGMPRVDIFYKDGKYYAVPIYIADFVKDKLPTLSKPHNVDFPVQPKENDKFYNKYYKFSLYPDELIFIEHEDGNKYLGYYTQYGAQNGVISFESIDRSNSIKVDCRISKKLKTEYEQKGIDTNTIPKYRFDKSKDVSLEQIKSLTKFQVDPLGYITEVKQEKRCGIIKDYKKQKNT